MANSDSIMQLEVDLEGTTYPIFIGRNLLLNHGLNQVVGNKQILIVTNKTVAPLYLERLKQTFSSPQVDVVLLEDGEQYKNQESLNQIYEILLTQRHHRDTTVIALGGGVIGDMAGFAAATYQRGVRLVQFPTTLLAQVDASIGGKTGINHVLGKNMIGCFYQPSAVYIDLETLHSLPLRELRAGFAEVIKYACLAGGSCWDLVQRTVNASQPGLSFLTKTPEFIQVIEACCRIKASIVAEDERELGQRALLNLGHTIGHALETYTHYQRWLHGEAVAIGLYCAMLLSEKVAGLVREKTEAVKALLIQAGLPYQIPIDIDLNRLRDLMASDKKIKENQLRFVVMKNLGECYLESSVTENCLKAVLNEAVEGE